MQLTYVNVSRSVGAKGGRQVPHRQGGKLDAHDEVKLLGPVHQVR